MQTFISLFLCAITVIPDPVGSHEEVKSSKLESKVLNGVLAEEGKYKYMASLQLDCSHVCSSSIIQLRFLLTTSDCASYIGVGIQVKLQRGTAVLTDLNLKKGQRIDIFKIAYHAGYRNYDYDLGVVMLASKIDYTHVEILNLYKKRINLQQREESATVCGWGTGDEYRYSSFGNVKYSANLHCTSILVYSEKTCVRVIPSGDYQRKLLCGQAKNQEEVTTLGDLGSPLTKEYYVNGTWKNYMIGIKIRRFTGIQSTMLRFIRLHSSVPNIEEMIKELELSALDIEQPT